MKNRNLNHKDDWATPKDLYDRLNAEFNFDHDPCPLNSKKDGLKGNWGKSNFINPPYSRKLKEAFIQKAFEESKKGKLCVMLLPVSTSTKIFHEIIYPNAEIRFLKGRVKFAGKNTKGEHVFNKCGMHDSMICIFRSVPFGSPAVEVVLKDLERIIWNLPDTAFLEGYFSVKPKIKISVKVYVKSITNAVALALEKQGIKVVWDNSNPAGDVTGGYIE